LPSWPSHFTCSTSRSERVSNNWPDWWPAVTIEIRHNPAVNAIGQQWWLHVRLPLSATVVRRQHRALCRECHRPMRPTANTTLTCACLSTMSLPSADTDDLEALVKSELIPSRCKQQQQQRRHHARVSQRSCTLISCYVVLSQPVEETKYSVLSSVVLVLTRWVWCKMHDAHKTPCVAGFTLHLQQCTSSASV
jgi:hypothetical protein